VERAQPGAQLLRRARRPGRADIADSHGHLARLDKLDYESW
jgi:hypothetical protein